MICSLLFCFSSKFVRHEFIPNFSEIKEPTVLSGLIKEKVPPLREVRWVFLGWIFVLFYLNEEVRKIIKWVVNDIYSPIQ